MSIELSIERCRKLANAADYDNALTFYDGVVATISKEIAELRATPRSAPGDIRDVSQARITSLQALRQSLDSEIQLVKQITEELNAFRRPGKAPSSLDRPASSHFPDLPNLEPRRPREVRTEVPASRGRFKSGGNAMRERPWRENKNYSGDRRTAGARSPQRRPQSSRARTPPSRVARQPTRHGPPERSHSERRPTHEEAEEGAEPAERKFEPAPGDGEFAAMVEHNMMDRCPSVHWDDIAGLDQAKKLLKEAVVLPLMLPELFKGIRRPWSGVLLFGPPGTGKTMIAKAVATECKTTFFNVSTSGPASKWRGDSERIIKVIFEMARFYAPSVVFFDEIDAVAGNRSGEQAEASRRMLSEMLQQMDGLASVSTAKDGSSERAQVMVLAATNYPWDIDQAMLRRLEKRIHIPLPEKETIEALLKLNMKGLSMEDVDFSALAEKCEGYSGADITVLCRDAAFEPIRRATAEVMDSDYGALDQSKIKNLPVLASDFESALASNNSSVDKRDVERHEKWRDEFGST